jgi:hypothetical protein
MANFMGRSKEQLGCPRVRMLAPAWSNFPALSGLWVHPSHDANRQVVTMKASNDQLKGFGHSADDAITFPIETHGVSRINPPCNGSSGVGQAQRRCLIQPHA